MICCCTLKGILLDKKKNCFTFAYINKAIFFRPDYAPWTGPDPSLLCKQPFSKSLAVGHDKSLLSKNKSCLAKGPQSELRKGPLRGLAQGSIYSQRNVTNTESRGK